MIAARYLLEYTVYVQGSFIINYQSDIIIEKIYRPDKIKPLIEKCLQRKFREESRS